MPTGDEVGVANSNTLLAPASATNAPADENATAWGEVNPLPTEVTVPESSVMPAPRPVPARYPVARMLVEAETVTPPPETPGRVGANCAVIEQLLPALYAVFAAQVPPVEVKLVLGANVIDVGVSLALKATATAPKLALNFVNS